VVLIGPVEGVQQEGEFPDNKKILSHVQFVGLVKSITAMPHPKNCDLAFVIFTHTLPSGWAHPGVSIILCFTCASDSLVIAE